MTPHQYRYLSIYSQIPKQIRRRLSPSTEHVSIDAASYGLLVRPIIERESTDYHNICIFRTTDTGVLEFRNNRQVIQRPSLWAINLNTNEVTWRYEFPVDVVPNDGAGNRHNDNNLINTL